MVDRALIVLALLALPAAAQDAEPATAPPKPAAAPAPATPDARETAAAEAVDKFLTHRTAAGGFAGAVLVAKGDTVLLAKGYGFADRKAKTPNTADTLFDIGSVAKPITATAVLRLYQAGSLDLDTSISKYLPRVPADKQPITVRHLLRHTSGLPVDISTTQGLQTTRAQYVAACMARPLDTAPGTTFKYNNRGYQLLAAIVESVTGRTFEDYVRDSLFKVAGMTTATFCAMNPAKDLKTAARRYADSTSTQDMGSARYFAYGWGFRGGTGVVCSVKDLHRFARSLDGERLLKDRYRTALFEPGPATRNYACGWYTQRKGQGLVKTWHYGTTRGFHAALFRYLGRGLVLAIAANDPGAHRTTYYGAEGAFIRALTK